MRVQASSFRVPCGGHAFNKWDLNWFGTSPQLNLLLEALLLLTNPPSAYLVGTQWC